MLIIFSDGLARHHEFSSMATALSPGPRLHRDKPAASQPVRHAWMGMVFLGSAMRGEQKLHAKFTACQSEDLDGTDEKPAAGLTMLPPSLLVPLGCLRVKCTLKPSPTPSLPQGTSTTIPPSPASHQEGDNSLLLVAFTGS